MSELEIDYETAMRECPEAAKEAIKALRKSRSKSKNADPKTLQWHYSWATKVQSYDISDVLSGAVKESEIDLLTVDELVEDECSRMICSVTVGTNRSRYHGDLDTVPESVKDLCRTRFEEEKVERDRVDSLTEDERNQEINELLKELRGLGGLFELKM